jgi:hypothetical protein
MRLLDEVYPGYDYLLLDEVQNLPHWDIWVTELFRQGKNMIITGSNANMLSIIWRYICSPIMRNTPWTGKDVQSISYLLRNGSSNF